MTVMLQHCKMITLKRVPSFWFAGCISGFDCNALREGFELDFKVSSLLEGNANQKKIIDCEIHI